MRVNVAWKRIFKKSIKWSKYLNLATGLLSIQLSFWTIEIWIELNSLAEMKKKNLLRLVTHVEATLLFIGFKNRKQQIECRKDEGHCLMADEQLEASKRELLHWSWYRPAFICTSAKSISILPIGKLQQSLRTIAAFFFIQ